jgi:tripartite-type tricarboxylate transporter receptor subunit TctC
MLTLALPAAAQDYPTRPVKILVQFPPGGVPDTTGRLLADKLSQAFGKPFVVENRPGAGGNIATELVAKSDPDGHTLLVAASASLAINSNLYKRLPFEMSDLAPISLVGSFDFVMLAAPAFAPRSVRELVELAKGQPGKINVASSGFGSEHHLSGELFNLLTGTRLTHVPYKGFGPATVDVIANQVELMFGSIPAALPLIRGGKLRALAVTGAARSADLPDVPTFAELGYPDLRVTSWTGLLAPARTPPAVLERIVTETVRTIQSPETAERIAKLGLRPMPAGPKAFAEQLTADTAFWARVIKQSGTKMVD